MARQAGLHIPGSHHTNCSRGETQMAFMVPRLGFQAWLAKAVEHLIGSCWLCLAGNYWLVTPSMLGGDPPTGSPPTRRV
jgi:hypothetical protein